MNRVGCWIFGHKWWSGTITLQPSRVTRLFISRKQPPGQTSCQICLRCREFQRTGGELWP